MRSLELRRAIAHQRSPRVRIWSFGPSRNGGISRPDGPNRLGAGRQQFASDFSVQDLFQPGQDPGDRGGVRDPVIPADHDPEGLVRLDHVIADDEGAGGNRV